MELNTQILKLCAELNRKQMILRTQFSMVFKIVWSKIDINAFGVCFQAKRSKKLKEWRGGDKGCVNGGGIEGFI